MKRTVYLHSVLEIQTLRLTHSNSLFSHRAKEMNNEEGLGYNFVREGNERRSKRLRGHQANQNNEALPRAKRTNTVNRRRTTAQPRKNRPHQDHIGMSLDCCTGKTCLLNYGHNIIALIRRDFDSKLYEEQNNYLNSLIDVELKTIRMKITYNIRDLSGLSKVGVCKKAFLKIFGIGKKRIRVLTRKAKPYSGDIEQDQRRFNRNEKRLTLALKAEVIEHIRSYDRDQSHYARGTTKERQFLKSSLTIAQLWRDFLAAKELQLDDAPLSYSAFRKIFRTFNLSFRRPYVDTCGKCDSLSVILQYSKDEEECASARDLKRNHIEKADGCYDSIHFDLNVLPKLKNKANGVSWITPPDWAS